MATRTSVTTATTNTAATEATTGASTPRGNTNGPGRKEVAQSGPRPVLGYGSKKAAGEALPPSKPLTGPALGLHRGRQRHHERQRLRRQDRHADLRPRRDDEDNHHRSQGRRQEGGQRDLLPGPVRQ